VRRLVEARETDRRASRRVRGHARHRIDDEEFRACDDVDDLDDANDETVVSLIDATTAKDQGLLLKALLDTTVYDRASQVPCVPWRLELHTGARPSAMNGGVL
jgi:hypothetical protein